MSIRKKQNQEEQEQKIAKYLDNRTPLMGYEKKVPKTLNSMRTHEKKRILTYLDNKRIYAHNFTFKFKLRENCKIPFSNSLRKVQLKNNCYYLLNLDSFSLRQTTKNLFITPSFHSLPALPGNSLELKAIMRAKCFKFVKQIQSRYIGLRVFAADAEPSTQSYAIKDRFASKLPFTYKNEVGEFDKSVRVEKDGHKVSGGEIEYFRPEHADMYLRMPIIFSEALAGYAEQIKLHLSVMQDMKHSLRAISGAGRPGKQRMPTSFKESATVRGVN